MKPKKARRIRLNKWWACFLNSPILGYFPIVGLGFFEKKSECEEVMRTRLSRTAKNYKAVNILITEIKPTRRKK